MKVCRTCGVAKPPSEFRLRSRETGERDTICISCSRAYQHDWYVSNRDDVIERAHARRNRIRAENRLRAWAYLGELPCVDCGEPDPVVLEFDHVRGEKKTEISRLISAGVAWSTIELELAKCEVRCVNCHMRRTARQLGFFDDKSAYRRVEDEPGRYPA